MTALTWTMVILFGVIVTCTFILAGFLVVLGILPGPRVKGRWRP